MTRPRIERTAVAIVIGGNAAMVAYVGLRGLGVPWMVAVPLILLLSVLAIIWLSHRLPPMLDGIRTQKPLLSMVWPLLCLVALIQTARLSTFMLDPTQPQHSLIPGDKWLVEHCCLTAYSESARLTREGEANIYKETLYRDRKLTPTESGQVSFTVDSYHYPPPFLLLPLMVRGVTGGDFVAVREVWFGMSALAFMLAIGLVARRLEPEGQLRAIGMAPLIWCSMPVLSGLQMSNVQILVVSISAIALALFPRRAFVGGMFLAMSTVAKIFPGILFVYLLARRKWREAAWTAGFAIVLTIVALIVVGPTPFRAFVEYELPRLSSGEAFSRPFTRAFAVSRNMAPFGIPLKLGWLGIPGMTLEVGRVVSMIYLIGVVGLAIWSGRRQPRSSTEAISIWLSLLSLGTLASPFAPANYVLVSLVWLACINRELFTPAAAVVIWLMISAPFLISRDAPFLLQAICYFPAQALAVGVPVVILWSAGTVRLYEEVREDKPVPALT
jgi:alpha-1,2-mannosyltransferase